MMAGLLAAAMTAGLPAACAPEKVKTEPVQAEQTVTVGEAADYLKTAADDYNKEVSRNELLKGIKSGTDDKATRLEVLVMVSRAFGELPEPKGNQKRLAPQEVDLENVPDWAREDLRNLNAGGVLAAGDLGFFEELSGSSVDGLMLKEDEISSDQEDGGYDIAVGDETAGGSAEETGREADAEDAEELYNTVTQKELETYCRRIYALFGTNLKDDFYANVNKSELENMELPEGQTEAGGSRTVAAETDEKLKALIQEIVESGREYGQGSHEQKIRDFYLSILAPRTEGISPLKEWFDKINAAKTLSELRDVQIEVIKQLGLTNSGLLPVSLSRDLEDTDKKVLNISSGFMAMTLEDYKNPESSAHKAYRASLTEQLEACGETQEEAERLADTMISWEKEQIEGGMSEEEAADMNNYNNIYSMEELEDMIPELGAVELLTGIGFDPSIQVQITDVKAFGIMAEHMNHSQLPVLKAQMKLSLLQNNQSLLTGEGSEEEALEAVKDYLSTELGQIYVARYFKPESKAGMEDLVKQMVEAFKKRIRKLEWMEEDTRKEALNKLENLTVLIGYPDEWPESRTIIRSTQDGGSYFSNMVAIGQENLRAEVENQFSGDREFDLPAYMVNAAAGQQANVLVFPAGIMQAPFYDPEASTEENLGGIGVIIAHEITHMFDDQGAQYDSDGAVRNWWKDSDYEHFKKLCKKVETAYDGMEAAAGIPIKGRDTLSENIADIGGAACALDILSGIEDPDYDAFFRNYAKSWLLVADRDTTAELAASDEHAPKKLRVNQVLSNFQEFLDTYNIEEGDGMYTAPEDRIRIW